MNYTIAIVDEGLLSLTTFRTRIPLLLSMHGKPWA